MRGSESDGTSLPGSSRKKDDVQKSVMIFSFSLLLVFPSDTFRGWRNEGVSNERTWEGAPRSPTPTHKIGPVPNTDRPLVTSKGRDTLRTDYYEVVAFYFSDTSLGSLKQTEKNLKNVIVNTTFSTKFRWQIVLQMEGSQPLPPNNSGGLFHYKLTTRRPSPTVNHLTCHDYI